MFQNELTNKIAEFLTGIGIDVVPALIEAGCFLPGILVENGRLLIDETKLKYPGNLLCEAGHLAMAPSTIRPT